MSHRTVRTIATLLMGAGIALAVEQVQPPEQHYQAARAALAKGDTRTAERELRLSLQNSPLDAQSHFLLASLLGWEGDLDQAAVGFQQAVKLEPNNAVARYNLGTAMLRRGESVPAARLLEESLLIRPEHVPTYNNLAKAYFLAGIPELSVACYREALRRDPSNPVALKGLALLTQAAGGRAGAEPGATAPAPPVNHVRPVAPAPTTPEPQTAEVAGKRVRPEIGTGVVGVVGNPTEQREGNEALLCLRGLMSESRAIMLPLHPLAEPCVPSWPSCVLPPPVGPSHPPRHWPGAGGRAETNTRPTPDTDAADLREASIGPPPCQRLAASLRANRSNPCLVALSPSAQWKRIYLSSLCFLLFNSLRPRLAQSRSKQEII
jgi:Flp pilus assembly protein TadD